jgi:hypothetical protein
MRAEEVALSVPGTALTYRPSIVYVCCRIGKPTLGEAPAYGRHKARRLRRFGRYHAPASNTRATIVGALPAAMVSTRGPIADVHVHMVGYHLAGDDVKLVLHLDLAQEIADPCGHRPGQNPLPVLGALYEVNLQVGIRIAPKAITVA